ncbi:MAG: hypothetical protein OQJ95_00945 [Kangiella sp.]|jgi:hypothetical protein|nr:hypothetical protein [Kangiella sp.]MCW9029206.1 hypothetical protein [Kangiella sp.]
MTELLKTISVMILLLILSACSDYSTYNECVSYKLEEGENRIVASTSCEREVRQGKIECDDSYCLPW